MQRGRLPEVFRDRTKAYAAAVIRLFVKLPKQRDEVLVCARQMLRAATSVASHVREASRARSDAEFVSKLGGALQECDESQLWLELLREECGVSREQTFPPSVSPRKKIPDWRPFFLRKSWNHRAS